MCFINHGKTTTTSLIKMATTKMKKVNLLVKKTLKNYFKTGLKLETGSEPTDLKNKLIFIKSGFT
jgi:UDP-N-acetylmuramate-alanine ligase